MRRVFRLTRLAGLVVVAGLALGLPQAGAITGGAPDGDNHPNVGIVFINDLPFTAGFCSGSLLSAHEFLTAGHCTFAFTVSGFTPGELNVSFDEQVSLSPTFAITASNPIAVTGWVTHPGFSCSSGLCRNDVGVIHLAEDVSLTPIDLPEVGFLDAQAARGGLHDHAFVNVGYGLNSLDRSFFSPQVNVTWEQRRMASSTAFRALTPDYLKQFGGICFGDSGGPHFYGGAYPNLAVATTSTDDPACRVEANSQRLDTRAVVDFLEHFTQ